MIAAFTNPVSTTLGSCAHTFHRAAFVNHNLFHIELAIFQTHTLILCLPVCNSAQNQFIHLGGRLSRAIFQNTQSLVHINSTNHIGNKTSLTGRSRIVHQLSHVEGLLGFFSCICTFSFSLSHFLLLSFWTYYFLALSFEPAWPRKIRVGANSPSLCPTIFSVT